MNDRPHVLLGVSGSIAAYKAAELVRRLQDHDCTVSVMMTRAATDYVGPLTFQALTGRPVAHGRFEGAPSGNFPHIDLAREADIILIAPCTANVMAKIAQGLADDILTATVLARDVPLVIAPAMNVRMWSNPATQANLATLRSRDIDVIDVGTGELACGDVGAGRLAAIEKILDALDRRLER